MLSSSEKVNSINQIFQVTINSSKLTILLNNIEKQLQSAHYEIQMLQKNAQENKYALNRKINLAQQSNLISFKSLFDKFKLQIKNELRQKDENYINSVFQKQQNMKELGYSVQTLNDKINKIKDTCQQNLQTSMKQLCIEQFSLKRQNQQLQDKFNSIKSKLGQRLEEMQSDWVQISGRIIQIDRILKLNYKQSQNTFNSKQNINKDFQQSFNTQKYKILRQKQLQQGDFKKYFKSQKQKTQRTMSRKKICKRKSIRKRQVPHAQSVNYMATLQYVSISQKVNLLQKKISQKEQFKEVERHSRLTRQQMDHNFANTGFFKRQSKNNMMKTYSYSKEQMQSLKQKKQQDEQSFFKTIQQYEEMDELDQMILKRIQKIQEQVIDKNKQNQSFFSKLKQKQIVFDQRLEVQNKKCNKNSSDAAQCKIKLLHFQKKFTNDSSSISSINELENQFSKLLKKFDKQLQTKANIVIFQEQKQKLSKKLNIVQQNLVDKVDKIQVKKAFNFLQDKIKQIILVIANDFNQDKVGAINRVPFKCLTCDRQKLKVENQKPKQKDKMMCFTTRKLQKSQNKAQTKEGCQYYTRLIKSKMSRKNLRGNNYTSMTQMTQTNQ